jgi:hypothetical protein
MRISVIDLETTSLIPEPFHGAGEPWEIGLITHDPAVALPNDGKHLWWAKPDLAKADPGALRVNRYYERTRRVQKPQVGHVVDLAARQDPNGPSWSDPGPLALEVAQRIDGTVLFGTNPGFDRDHLRPWLRRHGQALTTHYRPVCITTMAAGWLIGQGHGDAPALALPWSSETISRLLGVDPGGFDRHTALGDCEWVLAQYVVITGGAS